MMKNITKNIVLCFLLSCAVKSPPTGGPLDIDSPYIFDISPISGQTGLDEKESIQIYFNEMIDANSIKSSIEISPKIDIIVNSYGKRILIKPKKSWPSQKEFKIKIKRSISDYSGNNMNSSIILTYSTSDKISSGSILGEVFNTDSLKYCTLGLYEIKNDSLMLYSSIESDNENKFSFYNLKNGEYFVIGLMNRIRNIYSDYRIYPYGFYNQKIVLNDENNNYDKINIYIDSPNKNEGVLSVDMVNNFYGEVLLTNNDKLFFIDDIYFNKEYANLNEYIFFDSNSDSIDFIYTINNNIEFYKITDSYKLIENIKDTIPPVIENSYIEDDKYKIKFSEPVIISNPSFYRINNLEDTIYFDFKFINPKLIFLDNLDYENINISNSFISDLDGNLLNTNFTTVSIPNNEISEIGNIFGEVIYKGSNEIIIELINIHSGEINRVKGDELNKFIFKNIYPNKYKIWAYENINDVSDNYFNGTLLPLKLSAKFGIYNEVLEIRKNWDIEGVKITIMDNN